MAFHRGMDGSVTIGGVTISQSEGWSLNINGEELETTSQGDNWKSFTGGVAEWDGQQTIKLDRTIAAHASVLDVLMGATPNSVLAAMVFRAATGKQWSGNALVRSVQITSQLGQIVRATISFRGSGALATAWA